jgi:hypothetical protein
MHASSQQLETFTTQQATLQASINALQPLVLVAEKLSTRLESFESATANALTKIEGLVVEVAANLNEAKHSQAIIGVGSKNPSKKRRPSVSPPQSPEFPPFKKRKLDLAPGSPEIIPSSQPTSMSEDDSNDEPTSSTVTTLPFSAALPPTASTFKQAKYELDNQIPIILASSQPEKQNRNRARSDSPRSLEDTNRAANNPQATNITEHLRASFLQPPQIGLYPWLEDFRRTPYQVGVLSHCLQNLPLHLCPTYPTDSQATLPTCAH